jgi:Na+/melibiose symporter-like transporter
LGDVTDEIRMDLATLFLPIYCGLYVLGLVIVSKYRITRADHDENVQRLSERKTKLAD